MQSFLFKTAEDILLNHKTSYHNYCFIFPNKRTNYYFRKDLGNISGGAGKAPKMLEISSFIKQLTNLTEIDDLSLLFQLYGIFNSQSDNKKITFDNFYKLGEIIISDFNEIDSWLIDPFHIYKNINHIKEIEDEFDWLSEEQKNIIRQFWINFSPETKSDEKEIFLEIRKKLPVVYTKLKTELLNQNSAYRGLIYRYLSELIDQNKINDNHFQKYVFVGFNALNNSELKLFKFFQKNKKAIFYWNTDAYYQNDVHNEAGFFLRKNFNELNISEKVVSTRFNEPKNIKIIGISQVTGQARIIPALLNEIPQEDTTSETAIVLADENILFPVLNSIPDYVKDINVTMGVAFKYTPLKQLIRLIAELHLSNSMINITSIYYKYAIKLLKHPYIYKIDTVSADFIIQEIYQKKYSSVPIEIFEGLNKVYDLIFNEKTKLDNPIDFLDKLLKILFLLFDKQESQNDFHSLKNEYIFIAYKKIKKLKELIEIQNINLSLKLTVYYLNHLLNNEIIPFEGHIDKGLQITGIMETRNISFKNLIITGMNEGNFPKTIQKPTFISQSLRQAFGMPVFQHQDAVFAYILYSLIQQSENITILYNNLSDEKNSGEMSRFLMQLLYESNFNIKIHQITEKIEIPEYKKISIEKSPEIIDKLYNNYVLQDQNKQKNISNAFLDTYLDCTLKFYFSYIAEIKELETPGDDFSPALTGNLLHIIIKDLYNQFIQKTVKTEDIKQILPLIEIQTEKRIKEQFNISDNNTLTGNQIIIKTVLMKYIELILTYDISKVPFKIISLETNEFSSIFKLNFNDKNINVRLHGIIDRIDEKDNIFRIIDYKTGREQSVVNSVTNLFDRNFKNRSKHIFQILLYTHLFQESSKESEYHLKPILYYLRSMNNKEFSGNVLLKISEKENITINSDNLNQILSEFTDKLKILLTEIFFSDLPYEQTENTDNCKYCIYNKICNRLE